ncbi:MAG: tRNA (adenosine(37)-N6)-dimethylallyltransferase MiaA [Candidatus Planktophila sp.]
MQTIIICGATATGKSDLAVALAQEIGGEIVNADSMQVYEGMDIGTAKLTLEERKGIPHHLLDVLTVRQDSTVAWYQEIARKTIDEIHHRGENAIIVGGTGLYIKAIVDDLNFPDTDPVVRSRIELEAIEHGSAVLFARLEKLDPAAALAIDRANTRRIIRALEVIEITGQPFTANLPREASSRYPHAFHFGLSQDRESLDVRVSARVDAMWEAGLVEEVAGLALTGLREGVTAQKALGYAQVLQMMDGLLTSDQAREETKRVTRQYIRRQDTWFSRDGRIHWLGHYENRLEKILAQINS